MPFRNRKEAGKLLATHLTYHELNAPIVIALTRGGVPIGYQVAKTLHAPLDVLVVKKVGAPGNPEYGIGAVTEDGFSIIDDYAAESVGTTAEALQMTLERLKIEVTQRAHLYREGRHRTAVQGRTVILTDDGLATGISARVACAYLKKQGAKEVVLAVPVCAASSAEMIRSHTEAVICLEESDRFFSVGRFYDDFEQVSDEEVINLLKKSKHRLKPVFPLPVHAQPQMQSPPDETNYKLFGFSRNVNIPLAGTPGKEDRPNDYLEGSYTVPPGSRGIVIFAHGSGSSRRSPRNMDVATYLNKAGFGTLLFDLLTQEEAQNRRNVFDIPLLAARLRLATHFIKAQEPGAQLPVGYFGASTGAAAALWAAADLGTQISAVVSRGGRPDLASTRLTDVRTPTLLMVGSLDDTVIEMNRSALPYIKHADLVIIKGATHLFEEPGTLEEVSKYAVRWFNEQFIKKGIQVVPNKKAA